MIVMYSLNKEHKPQTNEKKYKQNKGSQQVKSLKIINRVETDNHSYIQELDASL